MARNSRFNSTSGSGRENKRPGRNQRDRDDRSGDRKEKKSFKPYSEKSGSSPKKEFKKRDESKSTGRPKRASPFYKDRGYGSPERREQNPDISASGSAKDQRESGTNAGRPKASPFYKDRGYGSPERRQPKEGPRSKNVRPGFKKRFDNKKPGPDKREFEGDSGDRGEGVRKPKERKSFIESRLDKQRKSRPVTEETAPKDGLIRLNKFISNSGVCSRREADELIANGLITVNGQTITELGHKVKLTDDVRHDGKKLKAEKPVYILINKPKGYITTTDDPQERNTVMKLIEGACKERVYPVGRLDRNTSGLLLLTNDGELTDKLSHPRNNVKKIYKAELDKPLTKADFQKILDGIHLEEGRAMVDDLAIVSEDSKTIGIELHIGWNRIIRRIFETLGYEVVKLDRSVYAGLDKKELQRGHWRFLRQDEIIRLKHFQ
jgi:23S rRNA pseudouridine2605 synthase